VWVCGCVGMWARGALPASRMEGQPTGMCVGVCVCVYLRVCCGLPEGLAADALL